MVSCAERVTLDVCGSASYNGFRTRRTAKGRTGRKVKEDRLEY
jgi:hypothetical protein